MISSAKVRMTLIVCSVSIFTLNAQAQGNLNPPPGPPQPMMKTLAQIEPRIPITNIPVTISHSGSYYLTTNLTMASAGNGITISADNVAIDLMGFTLDGDNTGSAGISQGSSYRNAVVRNGSLINWQSYGVLLEGGYNRIENIFSAFNEHGIRGGFGSFLKSCHAISNNASGSICYGIILDDNSSIQDSVSMYNLGVSYCYGIYAKPDCRISRCTVSYNFGSMYSYGICAFTNALITDCIADSNGGITGRWTEGIQIKGPGSIIRCRAFNNGTNYTDEALYIDGSHGSVIDCVANNNGGRGIMVVDDCLVRGNNCSENYTGIYMYGSRNRVENNVCNGNLDDGVSVVGSASNNFVVCNYASGNSDNFNVGTANVRGPESSVMTNHPWANFYH